MRSAAWIVAALFAAGGVAFGLLGPGDVATWVAPLTLLPIGCLTFLAIEDSWDAATRRTRLLVWLGAAGLAVAGAAWYLLAPTDGSWVVGGMLCIPVLVITPLLDRGHRADEGDPASPGWGEPFGPP